MKKRIIAIIILMSTLAVMGCSNKNAPVTTDEEANKKIDIEYADVNGSALRMDGVFSKVTDKVKEFSALMEKVKENSPVDYWDEKNFVAIPTIKLNTSLFDIYSNLNRRQTTDACLQQYVFPHYKDKEGEWTIQKWTCTEPKENTYLITFTNKKDAVKWEIDINYDSDHDWTQMTNRLGVNKNQYEADFYEYARKNKQEYFIQTTNDRLYVILNEDKSIKEFYYSKLNGSRRYRYPVDYDKAGNPIDDDKTYGKKILSVYNSADDTIFPRIMELTPDWVKEDEMNCIEVYLGYKDGTLTYERYNMLSNKIEKYIIDSNGNVTADTEEYISPDALEEETEEGVEETTEGTEEKKEKTK